MKLKIKFISESPIEPVDNFIFKTHDESVISINSKFILIPANFKTDLASIPRIFWSIYPPQYTEYVWPAILHDYLYSIQYKNDRKLCDNIFYQALLTKGVKKRRAFIFWLSVRIFGSAHYG